MLYFVCACVFDCLNATCRDFVYVNAKLLSRNLCGLNCDVSYNCSDPVSQPECVVVTSMRFSGVLVF